MNQARNWDTCMQPMTKVSVAGSLKEKGGRDKGPCFFLDFPYIHFTYTYTYRKLVFDTHAWIGMQLQRMGRGTHIYHTLLLLLPSTNLKLNAAMVVEKHQLMQITSQTHLVWELKLNHVYVPSTSNYHKHILTTHCAKQV